MQDRRTIGSLGLALALTACGASSAPPPAATPPASRPSADVSRATAEDLERFFAAIDEGDVPAVERMLAGAPALAGAANPKGHSAFLVALFQEAGEGFVRPQDNRILAAVLARRPTLDPMEAAAAGDRARVEAELARDPDYVRRVHAIGWTALHFAAFGGQGAIVTSLIGHGADPDARAKNKFDNTPLQVALLTSQGDVVRILVARGVDVNARQGEGVTALHEAAQNGDASIVQMLLDAGADATVRAGKNAESALDVAVANGHPEVASLLRSHGAK
jgi:ankyrin repeat protein